MPSQIRLFLENALGRGADKEAAVAASPEPHGLPAPPTFPSMLAMLQLHSVAP